MRQSHTWMLRHLLRAQRFAYFDVYVSPIHENPCADYEKQFRLFFRSAMSCRACVVLLSEKAVWHVVQGVAAYDCMLSHSLSGKTKWNRCVICREQVRRICGQKIWGSGRVESTIMYAAENYAILRRPFVMSSFDRAREREREKPRELILFFFSSIVDLLY